MIADGGFGAGEVCEGVQEGLGFSRGGFSVVGGGVGGEFLGRHSKDLGDPVVDKGVDHFEAAAIGAFRDKVGDGAGADDDVLDSLDFCKCLGILG